MNDHEISKVVTGVLRSNLASKGFKNADVASETDFDGGSIIRVTAHYGDAEVPSDEIIQALHQIRDELLSKGEERFVILTSDYPNDPESQIVEEAEE